MRTNKVWCLVCWRLGVKSSVSLSKYDFESALKTREQRKVKQIEELDWFKRERDEGWGPLEAEGG